MKTKYFTTGALPHYLLITVIALAVTSCGSYQSAPRDNDGIYGNGSGRQVYNQQENSNNNPQNLQYQDYFGSLTDNQQEVEVFTDVDNYQSSTNQQEYASGNSGWGGNSENITVNIYDNSWRYGMWNNYWYGSNYGWAFQWGYSPWYGPGWGIGWNNWYNPYYGYGWNSWYGPSYGYPIYPNYYPQNNYSNNAGIRGVRNDMYGRNASRTTTGRTATPIRNGDVRATLDNGNNNVRTTRGDVRNSTRTSNNTTRSSAPSTRSTSVRTYPSTRSNSNNTVPTGTRQQAPTRNYDATPTRNYNTAPTRSSSPSSPSMQSGGGRSSGGNMGGSTRSSNTGGRR